MKTLPDEFIFINPLLIIFTEVKFLLMNRAFSFLPNSCGKYSENYMVKITICSEKIGPEKCVLYLSTFILDGHSFCFVTSMVLNLVYIRLSDNIPGLNIKEMSK